ncbi:MAG: hypothetical protein QF412_12365 [Planctomycetota bacterium]|jgi:hypothetical protein|nr:hypothetical protein [Planctomycetota bacterium]
MAALRHGVVSLLLATITAGLTCQKDVAAERAFDVKEALKQFKDAVNDRKATKDQEAIGIIDSFLMEKGYATFAKKEQSDVRKALSSALTSTRVRREPEQKGVFVAAAVALGTMGKDGAKELVKAYKATKFKKKEWVSMRAVILKQVGKTKDVTQSKFLLDEATRAPEDPIMVAAGEALGGYQGEPQKIRKDLAKKLIVKYGQVYGNAHANLDPADPVRQRFMQTLAAIASPWNTTLGRLTSQDYRTAPEWQKYWNKNKSKNWDKDRPKVSR